MPSAPKPGDDTEIGLAEMIESLREELQASIESGQDKLVAFDVDKVELELKIALSRKAKGEAGVAFWVVKAGASGEAGRDTTHTFKLSLSPVRSDTSTRLRVGSVTRKTASRG
jgi:Trypsin-co-occurring domain 2